ncbi:unnamed protein product [Spirodela intermedia]|uniref:Auxin efflux carrier component n=1 Tax=Spirodela intermedia TaxID=51605 RepID=A0A7I8JJM2_SPIIN|nr:unnamed protein product [Spirodela intermedia]CAA6670348.1 unnamed protein product [Spirodela intermedia]
MIAGRDIYDVLAAMVPLYVAMIAAYGSVRWWKVFTPEQCAGINRFVALFAVPLLSFHFISSNNPYSMNYRFIAADSLQKAVVLAALVLWCNLTRRGSLDWSITFFSLSTLPNTLVMGIPLLRAMYGDSAADLMVQIVVLQSVYRAAKALIPDQFPDAAGSIASLTVDPDVLSLCGKEQLQADTEVGEDGRLHVVVRKSSSNVRSTVPSCNKSCSGVNSAPSMAARASSMTGVEIFSVQSSTLMTPRTSSFNQAEVYTDFDEEMGTRSPRSRSANFVIGKPLTSNLSHVYPAPNPTLRSETGWSGKEGLWKNGSGSNKELHVYTWSSSESPGSEGNLAASVDLGDLSDFPRDIVVSRAVDATSESTRSMRKAGIDGEPDADERSKSPNRKLQKKGEMVRGSLVSGEDRPTLPTYLMTRLILVMIWRKLIRNPNTYSSLFGLVWSLVSFRWHIEMPAIVRGSVSILSDAGLGMAMFSLGLFMALQPKIIACGKSIAAFSMAVRFLTGPAVAAATSTAIGLRGVLLRIAIVQAALPLGIVPFVFAKEYSCHAEVLSTAVIFGMLIALPTTILYYILLGV